MFLSCFFNLSFLLLLIIYIKMINLISTKFIEENLCSKKTYNVINYEIVPVSKKSGIFGEHYYLKIRMENKNGYSSKSYFLKALPMVDSQRQFTLEMGANFKEEQMFQKFIPMMEHKGIFLMRESVPKCYTLIRNEFIIFENLNHRGFRCLNQRESFSLENVELVIQKMVSLHASSIILEEKLSCGIDKYNLFIENKNEFKEMLYNDKPCSLALMEAMKKGAIGQIDLFQLDKSIVSVDVLKTELGDLIDKFVDFVKPSNKYRNVICHGDLWGNNLMFKSTDKSSDCKLVDFQSYRYSPPAQDLLSLIYFTTDRDFRRDHFDHVLKYYYSQLEETLNKFDIRIRAVFTFDQFLDSCKCDQVRKFAIVQAVTHFQIVMMSGEEMTWFLSDPEFNRRSMFEDRSELIAEMCARDYVYKEKLLESLLDFQELCLETLE